MANNNNNNNNNGNSNGSGKLNKMKPQQQQHVATAKKQTTTQNTEQRQQQQQQSSKQNTNNKKQKKNNNNNNNNNNNDKSYNKNNNGKNNTNNNNNNSNNNSNNNVNNKNNKSQNYAGNKIANKTSTDSQALQKLPQKQTQQLSQSQQQQHQQQSQQPQYQTSYRTLNNSYADAVGNTNINNSNNNNNHIKNILNNNDIDFPVDNSGNATTSGINIENKSLVKINAGDLLTAALVAPCAKCAKPMTQSVNDADFNFINNSLNLSPSSYPVLDSFVFTGKQYRKSKSYMGSRSAISSAASDSGHFGNGNGNGNGNANGSVKHHNGRHQYRRSYSDRRSSFDRNFAERNKGFVPIVPPARPVLSSSNIDYILVDFNKLTIIERVGKNRISYPIMQCGTIDAPDSSYHQQRSNRMDVYQIDDGFHSDGGTETPPPSPSSGSSIASTSDHGSLESVDTGGTQRLAVLSFEQVDKLHHVMDETVAIHGRGNFPTLEVKLKDLVNAVRRKLEADVGSGGAGVIVKDIRLNGGAASHVLASENQPYNDLDLIYAIELSSSRQFDRVKSAVLNTLLDLLPEGVCKRRIMPCALKEAYVGKMVKVNNNNDGDRWSLISLGNSPGHKNVELKFVDTMRRQFEFSVDSFQIVLDSLLLFYDCAALPISENFYPTVVGESVYGDFQEALYHLQKKLISTRQPEEIRGGGLLKYCNLLVRQYKPVDSQHIKTLERYMCSRFFIDFPDINTQTVKLEAYLRNHFWGVDEEPLQYQYLMHLHKVVESSTVCLMGHERRQTLSLIQSLAAQVLYKEQQKHHHQHQHQHQQTAPTQAQYIQTGPGQTYELQTSQQLQQQPQPTQTVTLVTTAAPQSQQVNGAAQPTQTTTIYVQQAPNNGQGVVPTTATICCAMPPGGDQQTQQAQAQTATVSQAIQIQPGPAGLIYANGYYYAPVIPTTICTCNSTWLST